MTRPASRRGLLALGLGGLLTGCGFHPVYLASDGGPGPATDLAAVQVEPIYDRPGQELRLALISRLESDSGERPRYDLKVNYWITGEGLGILQNTTVTRIRLIGNATWTLSSRGPRPVQLLAGADHVLEGLDTFDSQYFATDLETEAAQRRIAGQMADRIVLRLASWFHQHPDGTGKG
jgi:LPS-assembly lipoprotein